VVTNNSLTLHLIASIDNRPYLAADETDTIGVLQHHMYLERWFLNWMLSPWQVRIVSVPSDHLMGAPSLMSPRSILVANTWSCWPYRWSAGNHPLSEKGGGKIIFSLLLCEIGRLAPHLHLATLQTRARENFDFDWLPTCILLFHVLE